MLIVWAVFQIYPIIWLIYSSFKPSVDISQNMFALPKSLYFDNYDFNTFAERGITLGIYFKNRSVSFFPSFSIIFNF